MFELVKTTTKDNIYLHGLFKRGDKSKYAILHIHGFEGDFYSDNYIQVEADALKQNGHSFLSIQTRGTAKEKELVKIDNTTIEGGAHFELLKDAYKDIDAWVEFLIENGYHNIILQGISLGTIKAVRYLAEGTHTKYIKKLILISPPDLHAMANIISDGKYKELLDAAKEMVKQGKGNTIADPSVYKMKASYQTIVSMLTLDHFGKVFNFADKENNFMLLNKIDIPVKVIVGSEDEHINPLSKNNDPVKEAVDILKLNISDCIQKIIVDANHYYTGKEHELAQEVILFLVD